MCLSFKVITEKQQKKNKQPSFTLWYFPSDLKTIKRAACCVTLAPRMLLGMGGGGRCGNPEAPPINYNRSIEIFDFPHTDTGSRHHTLPSPIPLTQWAWHWNVTQHPTPDAHASSPKSGWGHAARTRVFASLGWCNQFSQWGNLQSSFFANSVGYFFGIAQVKIKAIYFYLFVCKKQLKFSLNVNLEICSKNIHMYIL